MKRLLAALLSLVLVFALAGCDPDYTPNPSGSPVSSYDPGPEQTVNFDSTPTEGPISYQDLFEIPAWNGTDAVAVINGNEPLFDDYDKTRTDPFEIYSAMDELGRCGAAYANICKELMPTEPRGEIGEVRPSGWHTQRYNDLIPGNYLYNRCHLIGFQLAGENATPENLITGTRYLNIEGMLPYENMIDDYVDATGGHVLYRVTPVFDGDNLVARGVLMEAYSVEDSGAGVKFCVFAYNNQPGIGIDYKTGESWRLDGGQDNPDEDKMTFVLNTRSGVYHKEGCESVNEMNEANKAVISATLQEMADAGYKPCGGCHPDQ